MAEEGRVYAYSRIRCTISARRIIKLISRMGKDIFNAWVKLPTLFFPVTGEDVVAMQGVNDDF
jgi:hypothetical protein